LDPQELLHAFSALGVTPIDRADPFRGAFYLPELQDTQDFLIRRMAQAAPAFLGNDYAFCRPALRNPNLLQELAEVLDVFIQPAVSARMFALNPSGTVPPPVPTLMDLYLTILDPDDATYLNDRNNFLALYPITQAAVARLTQNFQQNILSACKNIVKDGPLIQKFFSADYPSLQLRSLAQIESTGSDFHKGGKQVLILRFSIFWQPPGGFPRYTSLRLVYKPSDVEVDCLIVGNSAAINAVAPNFMAESLVEIFNALCVQQKAKLPDALPLPTYKILPVERMKTQPAGNPPFNHVPDFYGYIEYLAYEQPSGLSLFNYYASGASDCVIYRKVPEKPIITKFYQQLGQLTALACTFSLKDLHIQNVRVRGYQPYFIDLEISLGEFIQEAAGTSLLGGLFPGINGFKFSETVVVVVPPAHSGTFETLGLSGKAKPAQNRLYKLTSARHLVDVEPFSLLGGLSDGLTILANAPANRFDAWWTRVDAVLVRDLPYATQVLQTLRGAIFLGRRVAQQLLATITQVVGIQFAGDKASYVVGAPPTYLALAPGVSDTDFQNLDLPIFYRRVDQVNIVDARGNQVPVPSAEVGRDDYYAAPLLTDLKNQLNAISGPGNRDALDRRIAALQGQVRQDLNLKNAPTAAQFSFTAL